MEVLRVSLDVEIENPMAKADESRARESNANGSAERTGAGKTGSKTSSVARGLYVRYIARQSHVQQLLQKHATLSALFFDKEATGAEDSKAKNIIYPLEASNPFLECDFRSSRYLQEKPRFICSMRVWGTFKECFWSLNSELHMQIADQTSNLPLGLFFGHLLVRLVPLFHVAPFCFRRCALRFPGRKCEQPAAEGHDVSSASSQDSLLSFSTLAQVVDFVLLCGSYFGIYGWFQDLENKDCRFLLEGDQVCGGSECIEGLEVFLPLLMYITVAVGEALTVAKNSRREQHGALDVCYRDFQAKVSSMLLLHRVRPAQEVLVGFGRILLLAGMFAGFHRISYTQVPSSYARKAGISLDYQGYFFKRCFLFTVAASLRFSFKFFHAMQHSMESYRTRYKTQRFVHTMLSPAYCRLRQKHKASYYKSQLKVLMQVFRFAEQQAGGPVDASVSSEEKGNIEKRIGCWPSVVQQVWCTPLEWDCPFVEGVEKAASILNGKKGTLRAVVWGCSDCPFCEAAVSILNGVPLAEGEREEKQTDGKAWMWVIRTEGSDLLSIGLLREFSKCKLPTPSIFINGEFVGGHDDLKRLEGFGQLEQLRLAGQKADPQKQEEAAVSAKTHLGRANRSERSLVNLQRWNVIRKNINLRAELDDTEEDAQLAVCVLFSAMITVTALTNLNSISVQVFSSYLLAVTIFFCTKAINYGIAVNHHMRLDQAYLVQFLASRPSAVSCVGKVEGTATSDSDSDSEALANYIRDVISNLPISTHFTKLAGIDLTTSSLAQFLVPAVLTLGSMLVKLIETWDKCEMGFPQY
jgi:glutaredoxin